MYPKKSLKSSAKENLSAFPQLPNSGNYESMTNPKPLTDSKEKNKIWDGRNEPFSCVEQTAIKHQCNLPCREKGEKKPSEHSIVKAVLHHSFSWPQSSVGEKLPGANMVESELKWHLGTKRKKMCWILTVVSKTICGLCEDV